MQPHEKGDYTEAAVITELKRREISVSVPFGDNDRYDVVVETGAGELLRAQVKTGWYRDGVVQFKRYSQHTNAAGNSYKQYGDGIDCFLVYNHDIETLFFVWESEVGSNMTIRVADADQRHESTNWAEQYRFDERWPPETDRVRPVVGSSPAVEPVCERLRRDRIPFVQPEGVEYHFLACDRDGNRHALRACSGSVVNGRVRFSTVSSSNVDAYCVYCSETDETYLAPADGFGENLSLRVESPDQPDSSIKWADDYAFDEQWPP